MHYAKLEKNTAIKQKGGTGLKLSIKMKGKKRKLLNDEHGLYKKQRSNTKTGMH